MRTTLDLYIARCCTFDSAALTSIWSKLEETHHSGRRLILIPGAPNPSEFQVSIRTRINKSWTQIDSVDALIAERNPAIDPIDSIRFHSSNASGSFEVLLGFNRYYSIRITGDEAGDGSTLCRVESIARNESRNCATAWSFLATSADFLRENAWTRLAFRLILAGAVGFTCYVVYRRWTADRAVYDLADIIREHPELLDQVLSEDRAKLEARVQRATAIREQTGAEIPLTTILEVASLVGAWIAGSAIGASYRILFPKHEFLIGDGIRRSRRIASIRLAALTTFAGLSLSAALL